MGNFRFLFEVLPDLLPYDYFSEVEAVLWARFLEEKEQDGGRKQND